MSSETNRVETYGRLLVTNVRDSAIRACLLSLDPQAVGPGAELWRGVVSRPEVRDAVETLIPEIVDEAIFQMMNAIDNKDLPARAPSEGLGELAGWYMGSATWRSRFSEYPPFEPFTDLPLPPSIDPSQRKPQE